MTNEEKLARIEKHFAEQRAASPDGKTAWERVEDFRLKHGHLPDKSAAPCIHCFNERTEAIIQNNATSTLLQAARNAMSVRTTKETREQSTLNNALQALLADYDSKAK